MKKIQFICLAFAMVLSACSKDSNTSTNNNSNNSNSSNSKATLTMTIDGRTFTTNNGWGSYIESTATGQLVKSLGFANTDSTSMDRCVLTSSFTPSLNFTHTITTTSTPLPINPGDPVPPQFIYNKPNNTSGSKQYLAGPLSEFGRLTFKIVKIVDVSSTYKKVDYDFSGVLYTMSGSDSVVITNGTVRNY